MRKKLPIIAIDGPSAAGKSTLGKELAKRYGLTYIDTGAMYRAVAWLARHCNISWSDEGALIDLIQTRPMKMQMIGDTVEISIDSIDVTRHIRTQEIGSGASEISAIPGVKMAMIEKQRFMGNAGGVVMDGRDIGTYVFPDADFKFYLDASIRTRGLRRYNELKQKGEDIDIEGIIRSMQKRDHTDSNRKVAPLKIAPDAIVIDTTDLKIPEVLGIMATHIESKNALNLEI